MGLVNEKFEITSDVAAATVAGYTLLFTANTVSASATPTIASGSQATTAEAAVLFATVFSELTLIEADIAAIRAKVNA